MRALKRGFTRTMSTEHNDSLRIERLGPEDMGLVMELERSSFAYHWTEEQYRLGLEKGAFSIIGAWLDGELAGYLAYSLVVDEMEVLNLAVRPELRRRGQCQQRVFPGAGQSRLHRWRRHQ